LLSPAKDGPGKSLFYEVKPHDPPSVTARELEKAGIVSSGRMFYWYSRMTGKVPRFKAGDYRFTTNMKPSDVAAVIVSGIPYGIPVTVPEGFSMVQIAEAVEVARPGSGERFLKLCKNRKFIETLGFDNPPATLEGYLFPDTYLIGRKTPEDELIRQMVKKFHTIYTPELSTRAKAMGFTDHQVVTLASIVEKETGAKSERPMISSVFHNRLKKKMKLQSDPTVVYGLKDYDGNITRKLLDNYTPYNTYRIPALPPGPIANPGKDAILAALYPAESSFLYFVSHNDGTHEFTATYDDHRKAVVKFQIDPQARKGKSWRDLPKDKRAGR
jgi:UPF0755 protein